MDEFIAVDATELRRRLGSACSPMLGRGGYVIGPDVDGRICHCATCFSIGEAQQRADEMNAARRDKL